MRTITLDETILDQQWFDDSNVLKLWIYLLFNSATEDKDWKGMMIKSGQLVTSVATLTECLNMSTKIIRNCLDKLVKTKDISIKSTNRFSVITILNFEKWANKGQTKGQTEGQTEGQTKGQTEGQTKGKQRANKNATQITDIQEVRDSEHSDCFLEELPDSETEGQTKGQTKGQTEGQTEENKKEQETEEKKVTKEIEDKEIEIKKEINLEIKKEDILCISKKETETPPPTPSPKRFVKPTLDEVREYIEKKGSRVDPEEFFYHYESVNWYRGKTKINNWHMCVATWEKNIRHERPKRIIQADSNGNPIGFREEPRTSAGQVSAEDRRAERMALRQMCESVLQNATPCYDK